MTDELHTEGRALSLLPGVGTTRLPRGKPGFPQCQDARARDGSKTKTTHFLLVVPSKISLPGPIEKQEYFCSIAYARKLPVSPPTAVSAVKYQQQSLQIAQNTRVSAVFLTEVLPKLFTQRCGHTTYPMAMQDEIIMTVKQNSRRFYTRLSEHQPFLPAVPRNPGYGRQGLCCAGCCADTRRKDSPGCKRAQSDKRYSWWNRRKTHATSPTVHLRQGQHFSGDTRQTLVRHQCCPGAADGLYDQPCYL